ncbi:VIT family protein [soil metagenome]
MLHHERHAIARIGWLRAAVLGANDGIVSTGSLIIGVAAAAPGRETIVLSGIAALVAGAMSMAAGEYVSVGSQADTENADLNKERRELADEPEMERRELAAIYVGRGLDPMLAGQVADQLTAHDALGAHARDELGITAMNTPRPAQAAAASALTFAGGAAAPLAAVIFVPVDTLLYVVPIVSLLALALLGYLGARTGGAHGGKAVLRVTVLGALAMAITAGIGRLAGAVV